MLSWRKIYFTLLNLLIKFLVKSKVIPINPCIEFGIDTNLNIAYILPYTSKIELIILRIQCIKYKLPDPCVPISINSSNIPRYIFINKRQHISSYASNKLNLFPLLHSYLDLYRSNFVLDIQLIPVLVMLGRSPNKNLKLNKLVLKLKLLNSFKKFLTILWLGRDSFIQFLQPLSLRNIVTNYGTDRFTIQKLIRVMNIHFIRQRLIATGPNIKIRQNLFIKLLKSKNIKKAIEDEARIKNTSIKTVQQNTIKIMEEITANCSYEVIRLSDRILGWILSRLYQNIHINNYKRVRQIAEKGHEIIYIPCHRSHMDYLLISYVLYHQGLALPHIAAGINLNFWPVGSIFRSLGAFFIRRNFKGNKLYSIIFREYLSELLSNGCSLEYFIEGGRSRTGRLLKPKTGILTMTIQQAMLQKSNRPITLIPIYIGYEHVLEVTTYIKELCGARKKNEGLLQMLRGLFQLRNLGQGYINFGNPLLLISCLPKQTSQKYKYISSIKNQRPEWLVILANNIANNLMVRINNAAVANAINLCSTILLAAFQYSLTRLQLISQLTCYLELLRNVPYTPDVIIPNLKPEVLLNYALKMKKFTVKYGNVYDVMYLSRKQVILATYYRNNIQHILTLPSLISSLIHNYPGISKQQLYQYILLIYPFLQAELFIRYNKKQLSQIISSLINELLRQRLIEVKNMLLYPIGKRVFSLHLLAANINEILKRYTIIFLLLRNHSKLNRDLIKKESKILAQRLLVIDDINIIEFSNRTSLSTLLEILLIEKYINSNGLANYKKVNNMYNILSKLISPDILKIIEIPVD